MEPRNAPEIFLKPYNAAEQESEILKKWDESGYANPDRCIEDGITKPDAETFSIVLPPPNVTGILHMGSALMVAIEDIFVRYARMNGKRTLWIPGTDSAAIATQARVEGDMYKKEKKTRHDIGREELLKRIEAFTDESKNTIINQLKMMGATLDWSRYAYTMDERRYNAVIEAFVRMYKSRLIYRGNRIVNWDPKLQTTVSDEEIEYVEQTDPFYYFQYGPFVIGTVRPETKFGDKYVVMHPDDERYKDFKHGQTLELEWINGPITATVIKDEAADMAVGSGVMTITPSHSATDFEIAQKHKLDVEHVIDERGILLPIAGEFAGQHIKKARATIVEKLRKKGLVVKVDENYVHNVATNSRGGGVIEPQIKKQWFVGVDREFTIEHSEIPGLPSGSKITLKRMMRTAVEHGGVKIAPERFERIYYNWIDNLRDWNISRQIWFGHRIPAWFKGDDVYVGIDPPKETGWEQDPDVLDTWFSSGLWTFSTLGWPHFAQSATRRKPGPENDLANYHPTTVLETGYDILFFWVARMILMSGFHLGQIPFRHVYLHGIVRDGQGRKISKSLGNNIDPIDMASKYGMDAVRMSLIAGMAPGTDSRISEEKIRGYKKFANKLWNIARFVLEVQQPATDPELTPEDDELLREIDLIATEVTQDLENFKFHLAAEKLYHYVWHRFADEIIEESKQILKGDDQHGAASRSFALYHILLTCLRLLHPFMPFVTEAIWQQLPEKDSDLLMIARWPQNK